MFSGGKKRHQWYEMVHYIFTIYVLKTLILRVKYCGIIKSSSCLKWE